MMLFLSTLYELPQFKLARFFLAKTEEAVEEDRPLDSAPAYARYGELGSPAEEPTNFRDMNGLYQ